MKVTAEHSIHSATRAQRSESNTPFFSPTRAENGDAVATAEPFFQPKLKVGSPNDKYEQEADAVADQVVQRMAEEKARPQVQSKVETSKEPTVQRAVAAPIHSPLPISRIRRSVEPEAEEKTESEGEEVALQRKSIFDSDGEGTVQRKCDACSANEEESHVQRFPALDVPTGVQRKCSACEAEEKIQPKAMPALQRSEDGSSTASSDFSSRLASSSGGGSPLPAETQESMGSAIGADFSGVRVHTGSEASGLSSEIGAQAFTHGSDVYFNEGKYDPGSSGGQRLLAHELTHTVQQGGTTDIKRETIFPEVPETGEKEEADQKTSDEEVLNEPSSEKLAGGKLPSTGNGSSGTIDIAPPIEFQEKGPEISMKKEPGLSSVQPLTSHPFIQRYEAPPQNVETVSTPAIKNEGSKVVGNLDSEVAASGFKEGEEISREQKLGKASKLEKKGATKPNEDHGAKAKEVSSAQKAEISEKLSEQSPPTEEKTSAQPPGKKDASKGEIAEAEAKKHAANTKSIALPIKPLPFQHPKLETPKDGENDDLPNDGKTDQAVRGLGFIGEMLRDEGYRIQLTAYELEKSSKGLKGVLSLITADVSFGEDGVNILQETQDLETQANETAGQALVESKDRKGFVAEEATKIKETTAEKINDTKELSQDAKSKANEAESNRPEDEDAKADAAKQEAELNESIDGSIKVDQAMMGAHAQVQQFEADAIHAEEKNIASEVAIQERTGLLDQKQGRINEMAEKNTQTRLQLSESNPKPNILQNFAQKDYIDGTELIEASKVMESDLADIQEKYLSESKEVPGIKEIAEREKEAAEAQKGADTEIDELLLISQMEPADQEVYAANLSEDSKAKLLNRLDLLIQADEQAAQQSQSDSADQEEGQSDQPEDKRAPWYLLVQNLRKGRLIKVYGVADNKMSFLSTAQKKILAQQIEHANIKDDISNIVSWQTVKAMLQPYELGKNLVLGPWNAIKGIADKSKKWGELWGQNPLGAVIQAAADITTGLAILFSSIVALAGIVAVVLTIAGFFFPPLLIPVPYLATVITYASWGAIISGLLAIDFNQLAYLKNLSEAGTSETAEELFQNADEMKQNTYDGLQSAMAVVEGVGGVKMGPGLKSSAQTLKQTLPKGLSGFGGRMVMLKEMSKAALIQVATAPARFVASISRLFGKGKAGLKAFREYLRSLFSSSKTTKPDIDINAPSSKKSSIADVPDTNKLKNKVDINDTKAKNGKDLTPDEIKAEVSSFKDGRVKKVKDSEYDLEIELPNGHKYKRKKNGKWCRFSDPYCFLEADGFPSDREMYESLKKGGLETETFDEWKGVQDQAALDAVDAQPWVRPKGWKLPKKKKGKWAGAIGDSDFVPNNPADYGLKPGQTIPFERGVPNFEKYAIDTFEVPGMNGVHKYDMPLIHKYLAERMGLPNPTAALKWLSANGITAHHFRGVTIQLVPRKIHGPLGHTGSASVMRNK